MAYGRPQKARRYSGGKYCSGRHSRVWYRGERPPTGFRLWLWPPIVFAWLGFSLAATASPSFLPAAPISLTAPPLTINIAPYVELLTDHSGDLTVIQVTDPALADQFVPAANDQLALGYSSAVHWLRFTLANAPPEPLLLRIFPADTNDITLYRYELGGDRKQLPPDNTLRPGSPAQLAPPYAYYTLPRPATGKATYYLRLQSDQHLNLNILLADGISALKLQSQHDQRLGIFIGGILILVLINLGQRLITRSAEYFWYGAYLLTFALYIASSFGFFKGDFPALGSQRDLIPPLTLYLALICFCQFSARYFNVAHQLPHWRMCLHGLSALAGAGILSAPFSDTIVREGLLAAVTGLTMLSCFVLGIYCLLRNIKHAQVYTVSRLIVTPAVLALILGQFQMLPWSVYAYWYLMIALAIEAMIITYSLIQFSVSRLNQRLRRHHEHTLNHTIKRTYANTLRTVSDEMRTPISSVMGMAELLLDTSLTRNQREQALTIRRSGQALMKWLGYLEDWSALQTGKLAFNQLPFEPKALLQEFFEDSTEKAADRHVTLVLELDPRLPTLLQGDPQRIKQILSAMFEYALFYSEQGQLTLAARPGEGKNHWLLELRDSQSGLQPEEVKAISEENLFEGAADISALRRNWIIAQRLSQHMGGAIRVELDQQGGVCYCCDIRLRRHTLLQQSEADYDLLLRGKRLLVVDDSISSRKLVCDRAERWGMRVSSAPGGEEALAMLRATAKLGGHYDLIILDYSMPDMNGLELAHHIQSDPRLSCDTTLIMLSGVAVMPSTETAGKAGIRRVMSKPISAKTLKITLAEELTLAQKRRRVSI